MQRRSGKSVKNDDGRQFSVWGFDLEKTNMNECICFFYETIHFFFQPAQLFFLVDKAQNMY